MGEIGGNRIKRLYTELTEDQLKVHKLLIDRIAKSIIPNYVWTKELGDIATKMIYYFNGLVYMPESEDALDLNKSIALTGTYGVGKTILMQIFQKYMNHLTGILGHPNIYRIVSIEEVITTMSDQGFIDSEILFNRRTELDRPVKRPAHLVVNEFGYKYEGKMFGTEYQELVEIFLMKRYDILQDYGKLTHVTMNLDTDELVSVFGEGRLVDRFKEMFNIVPLDGISYRK